MELKEKLQTLRIDALQQVESAEELQSLNQVRISYLGKKGPITEALRGMKDLSPEERPVIGTLANELRDDIEAAIQAKKDALEIKKMEAEINKPRPRGESYNNEPKAQELSIQQQDGYRKRPRM